ncbi:MAG: helix-turn-helix transcriptional regulator [Lachnospiraceae bacterium]|nr:helix-turn-helix transcriptional regulator [Lachnospiraceae bacterium]
MFQIANPSLKALRQFRHLTIEEVAKECGVSKATISALETYQRPASKAMMNMFAKIYGCKVEDIFTPFKESDCSENNNENEQEEHDNI